MYIIEIDKLYREPFNQFFGYIGLEYESGKIRYFTAYDSLGIYHDNQLYEFHINNPPNHLEHCIKEYNRRKYLPSQLQMLAKTIIEQHLEFNKKNGYSISELKFNKKNISINYVNFKSINYNTKYIPVENKIQVNVHKKMWPNLNETEKTAYEHELLREIGYMKATKKTFNKATNELYVKTGFSTTIYTYTPIALSNGDVFLKFEGEKNFQNAAYGQTLEVIMNEYECQQINPEYKNKYFNLGQILNELCDNKLAVARYNDGIEGYYNILKSIINDKYLAEELLDSIIELIKSYESEYDRNMSYTLKLIKRYQNAKKNI